MSSVGVRDTEPVLDFSRWICVYVGGDSGWNDAESFIDHIVIGISTANGFIPTVMLIPAVSHMNGQTNTRPTTVCQNLSASLTEAARSINSLSINRW